ncbi:DUF397 domain-containing protein [Streptomyces sp. 4N509B]|uniref:DUF397 domain-containing protein n=1 Tax=Streptomyces sp. 4N509B TaxID=3457413 RepID=UPI003FD391CB
MTAPDLKSAIWRKSSYSPGGMENGDCVEIADAAPGVVPVRDSKRADSPVLIVPAHAWSTFVQTLK